MGIVTALEAQKRSGRVNVYIDGAFCVGIDEKLLVDFNLYKGRELADNEIENLKNAEQTSKCLAAAYRFLSVRPRSEYEMKEKLLQKFCQQDVDKVITKLKEYNYINDQEFTRLWIASRGNSRGQKALGFELKKKGVTKETICEELEKIDPENELENARNLIGSKKKYQNLDRNSAYAKIGGFLSRRGYNYEVIKKVLDEYAK